MKPIKPTAQIIFGRTCWTDNKLCSISVSSVVAGNKTIEFDRPFNSGIHGNEFSAMRAVCDKIISWNHGRYFFTNLQSKNGARNTITNNARAWNAQQMHTYRVDNPQWRKKAPLVRNGAKVGNKVYECFEKTRGTKIRHTNTDIRADNPNYKPNPQQRDFESNYQSGDAWKWDRQNPNNPKSEYVM